MEDVDVPPPISLSDVPAAAYAPAAAGIILSERPGDAAINLSAQYGLPAKPSEPDDPSILLYRACERNEEVVIVAGHSLYFRQFFRSFLPHACEHVSKNKKIDNGKRARPRAPPLGLPHAPTRAQVERSPSI